MDFSDINETPAILTNAQDLFECLSPEEQARVLACSEPRLVMSDLWDLYCNQLNYESRSWTEDGGLGEEFEAALSEYEEEVLTEE